MELGVWGYIVNANIINRDLGILIKSRFYFLQYEKKDIDKVLYKRKL